MQKVLVDTNLILRYLMDGDTLLPETAKANLVWLTNEVIFETIHALVRIYKIGRPDTFDLMVGLLMKPNVESDRVLIVNTLAMFRDNGSLSFIDCFLICLSEREKLKLITYDKKMVRRKSR